MTQAELAERAGLSVLTVRRLESGAEGTEISSAVRVLFALGLEDSLAAFGDDPLALPGDEDRLPRRVRTDSGRKF